MKDEAVSKCVVRVKTTVWSDKRGLHTKRSLTFLRRRCEGVNILEEDVGAIGAEEVTSRIPNLWEVKDGVYTLVTCNDRRDYETGYIEDYDYKLVSCLED